MKTTNTTTADRLAAILALLTEDEAAALASLAAEAQPPKAPKAPKGKKAPKPEAGHLDPEAWTSYRTADGAPAMGKAKNLPKDARDVMSHTNQGQALQRRNALAKAEAPKAEAPKTAPKAEAAPADLDERAARIAAKNAAIIATAPEERRALIENKVKQAHKAGYPYARLVRNKQHQMDGLHLYPGEKGHGRDAEFMALVTKAGANYRTKADKARADGKPAPKQPARVWYWSPVGGGNLYIRGIFGEAQDA